MQEAEDIFKKRAAELEEQSSGDIFEKRAALNKRDDSLLGDIKRGFKRSSIATPFVAPDEEQAPTFGGRLTESLGEIAGDVPAMTGGGLGGALGGAALGSFAGPIGTAIGALLGGGAGAFALPQAIKSTAKEVRKGSPVGEALKNVLYETGKSGLVGAATGAAGKAAGPLLRSVGGKAGEKILSSALGRGATETAGELAGMTAGQAFTRESPSLEGLAQNALLMGGLKGAHALGSKIMPKAPTAIDEAFKTGPKERNRYFDMLKDHVGERNAKTVESVFNWRERLSKAEEKGKFTSEQLEDMTYYRQRTGNPHKEGDSIAALTKRLPEHARDFVDNVIGPHLKETLETYNSNPVTKDIHPRQILEDIYLPGLYEGDESSLRKAIQRIEGKFKLKNPFADAKTFLTYEEAFKEAGLKPRYKNIVDLVKHYDKVMIRATTNAEFIDKIHNLEKQAGKQLIIRAPKSKISRAYNDARNNGYVPFDDIFLKGDSSKPALVDPELAPALQGIFMKDAYKPDSKIMQYYDAIGDKLRYLHVNLSPFHYVALTEHAVPALRSMNIRNWMQQGHELRNNKEFMMDAARSGLTLGHGDTKGSYLFNEFQPNIKAMTWDNWSQKMIDKLIKNETPPNAEQIKSIKRDMATFVNNLYGGQQWETLQYFNDPKNLKNIRRLIAYPDWSLSAIKNAQSIFAGGPLGEATRKTWFNYALFYFGTRALMDAFYKGIVQTDKDKSPSGIRFDPKKMIDSLSLTGKGPEQWYQFPLPDVPVKIAGYEFNPGRDAKGHRTYGHLGKSAIEIGHYFTKPIGEMFSKSNPLLQIIYKQLTGTTPSDKGPFMIQGAYKHGRHVPWGGTEPGTYDRFVARSKQLASEVLPFSARGILPESITGEKSEGISRLVGSLGGAHATSKGLTPYKAEPYIEEAIKKGDTKRLKELKVLLVENGYSEKEINKKINLIYNKEHPKQKSLKKRLTMKREKTTYADTI